MKANAKSKRPEAERAAEWYARDVLGCVKTVRSIRTQYQRQDLFGSDCLGKRPDGSMVYLQVTAGQDSAVSSRRRKLEGIPWHPTDTVQLLQLVQTPDPANGRRTLWWFRVHEYGARFQWYNGSVPLEQQWEWTTSEDAIPIPKEWFKAWRSE